MVLPKFNLGDSVRYPGFVDCFGNAIPEACGVVVGRRLMSGMSIPDYWRYEMRKHGSTNDWDIEAAERFFQPVH